MNFKFWKKAVKDNPKPPATAPQTNGLARADDFATNYGYGGNGGLVNTSTGLGDPMRDKVLAGAYYDGFKITDEELQALFNSNALAARIVELLPNEMFREEFKLLFSDPEGDGENDELAEEVAEYGETLGLTRHVQEGMIQGRLFGGDLLLIGADDGLDPQEPLNEANIRSIRYFNNVDRRYLQARSYYQDPLNPKFGEVETYQLTGEFGQAPLSIIHESRVIRFEGAPTDIRKRRTLGGWTLSVLQRPYNSLQAYDTSFQAAANLMVDASQAVFKMKGLMDIITSDRDGILAMRMALVDYTRSAGRAVLVDADTEDFERKATSFTGIPEMLGQFQSKLSGDTGYPITLLFGRSAAGMNATGEGDARNWYDHVASLQKKLLKPILLRLFRLICLAKDGPTGGVLPEEGMDIGFDPLWQMSAAEIATLHYTQAQADAIYVTNQVVFAEEIAISRFAGGEYSLDTKIDVEARKKSLAAELDFSVQNSETKAENGPIDPSAPHADPNVPPTDPAADPAEK